MAARYAIGLARGVYLRAETLQRARTIGGQAVAGPSRHRGFLSTVSCSSKPPPASLLLSRQVSIRSLRPVSLNRHSLLANGLRYNSSATEKSPLPDSIKVTIPQPPQSPAPASPTSISTPPTTEISPSNPPVQQIKKPPDDPQLSADTASILKLLKLASPQWRLLATGFGCLCISTGVGLAFPYFSARIIDFFNPATDADTMFLGLSLRDAALVMAGTFALGALATTGKSISLKLSGQRTAAMIR